MLLDGELPARRTSSSLWCSKRNPGTDDKEFTEKSRYSRAKLKRRKLPGHLVRALSAITTFRSLGRRQKGSFSKWAAVSLLDFR